MPDTQLKDIFQITGAVLVGDSMSDEEIKYNEYICGCFPFKWFLHHSDYNDFTNGHTWAYIFSDVLNNILKENSTWSAHEKPTYFKNVAEGGATTYDYKNIKSFFKHIKGFILSFFLGNIQKQAKKIKKEKNILSPNTLGIIFAGANDLVTLGYDDEAGVERAVQGIVKTIRTLTSRNEKTGTNYLKSILLIGLPDISETPRFANKSSKEKLKMKLACQQFNQKLQELANEYQYVNFNFCTIYQYISIKLLALETVKNIKKGIIITGEGRKKTILFVNNGQFITNKSNQKLKQVNITLTNEQLEILSKEGKILRNEVNGNKLDEFVNEITQNAKLNIDLKMLDIGVFFDKICQNPEAYGFTSGCAVYYLTETKDQEIDKLLISKNITTGNAVVIREIDNEFFSYLVKNGKLIKKQDTLAQVKFELSEDNQIHLKEKITQHVPEKIIKLAGMEDKHDICIIHIIQSVIEQYKRIFDKEIKLINIDATVLNDIEKGYPNRNEISWDGLHPPRRIHVLLAEEITKAIKEYYLIKNESEFEDDSSINVESKLDSDESEKSSASLLYSK